MNSEETHEELITSAAMVPTGPGRLLANKREALGLSVQQVADDLHITMHYVRALEDDAHEKLPGDVFIRGYIRSYATLLKLDPNVLVNVYNEFASQRDCEQLQAVQYRKRGHRDRNLPWILVSGIAFIAIAVALWYFSNSSDAAAVPTRDMTANISSTQTPSNSDPISLDAISGSRSAPTALATAPAQAPGDESVVVIDELGAAAVSTPDAGGDVPASASVKPEFSAAVTAVVPENFARADLELETLNDVSVASNFEARGTGRNISLDAGGEDKIHLKFSGESLVQIEDASEQQIYREVRSAGDTLQITGNAPFNVLLGDASVAELQLNGSHVDFSSSIRIDKSARLTIGL